MKMIVRIPVIVNHLYVGSVDFILVQPHFPSLSENSIIMIGENSFEYNNIDSISMKVYKYNGVVNTDIFIKCESFTLDYLSSLDIIFKDAKEFDGIWNLSNKFKDLLVEQSDDKEIQNIKKLLENYKIALDSEK